MAQQQTIGSSVSLSGIGLHTGNKTTITLNPAEENYGIRFVAADIPNSPEILADIDNVTDVKLGTTIGSDGVCIHTIEHLMSALAGLQVDNCRVDVHGSEVPVTDGSSFPFVEMIQEAGVVEQTTEREYIIIDRPMWLYNKDDVALSVFPSDHFHITLMIDYNHPAVGAQHTTLFSLDDYSREFAPARTFCFLSWMEKIREEGLIKGGSLDCAVIVQDVPLTDHHKDYLQRLFNARGPITEGENGYLNNTPLRFKNELCRHKAVDLIGDLYLLGKPVCGHVLAARTGHAANIEMARKIREYIKEREERKANVTTSEKITHEDILNTLPHRYPMLLIDKIEEFDAGKRIIAGKNVSFNDQFFQGHFPDNPVMPGVLQVEAMAQAVTFMAQFGRNENKDGVVLFLGIDKARFRGIVRPGDYLRIECEVLQSRRNTVRVAGKCYVGDKVVSEAEILGHIGAKGA